MIDEEPRGDFAADQRNTPQGLSRHFAEGQENLPAEDLPATCRPSAHSITAAIHPPRIYAASARPWSVSDRYRS